MQLLLLEDSINDASLVEDIVQAEWPGTRIMRVGKRAEFVAALEGGDFDLILSDYTLPGFDGLTALGLARSRRPEKPFIFFSGTIGEERAIETLQRGAADYVPKDRPARIVPAIRRALAHAGDVSARHLAEEQLRGQAALLDKARDAIIATDLRHRIAYWNASAERIYGWSAAEVFGRDLNELGLCYDPARVAAARDRVLKSGEWRGDFSLRTKRGEVIQVDSTWSLVRDAAGKAQSILLIDTDVTERKRLESQVLRADRMDSIGMLAGGVAHDLNNVLAPILMGSELMRMHGLEPYNLHIMENIERSARHGAALVRQLLAFARGDEVELAEVNVPALIQDVEKLLRQGLPRTIELRIDCAGARSSIHADATQIKQLLLNLALNARDAMPKGGSLEIRADDAIVGEALARQHPGARPGRHVRIAVTDEGAGIPPALLSKIFDPFFTTKGIGKGTGLGLSVVLGIVKHHGGFLEVESEVGRGTTFRLYFPTRDPMPPAADRSANPFALVGNGELVLVVDDEASMRDTLQLVLEKSGYRVVTAVDGPSGLAEFDRQPDSVAVVFTDIRMPGMHGADFIAAVRTRRPQQRIMAMSGSMNSKQSSALLAMNPPVEVLSKPISSEALLLALRRILAGKAPRHRGA